MIIDEAVYLEHHGVKGQKWGVRNKKESERDRNRKKTAVVVLGSAAVIGSLAVGAIYARKHFGVRVKDLPEASNATKNFARSMAKEPVSIISATRGKNRGFMFVNHGGVKSPLREYEAAFGADSGKQLFKRYGERSEKVAVSFLDPLGRKDFSGRVIPHQVILPETMAKGINSHKDAVDVAWPKIKDIFGALYESKPDTLGPGF